ncbi:MAG: hypothetical protein M1840_004923 [Geoglossum simile]|nr:MAG: hypothetical protein M1840_004923 [Geoglossum simile]
MHREAARRLITPSRRKPEATPRPQPKPPARGTATEGIASILSNSPAPSSAEVLGPIVSGHLGSLSRLFSQNQAARKAANKPPASTRDTDILDYGISSLNPESRLLAVEPPYHLHIYAHKHNTHVTLTRPNGDAIISVSTGNIGFRKAARSTYDAAYQLAAYVLGRIQEQGLIRQIKELELVLRGYGAGREACTKVLLGSEGRFIRSKIVRVTDATRLKFGGTRSKKPRRLG